MYVCMYALHPTRVGDSSAPPHTIHCLSLVTDVVVHVPCANWYSGLWLGRVRGENSQFESSISAVNSVTNGVIFSVIVCLLSNYYIYWQLLRYLVLFYLNVVSKQQFYYLVIDSQYSIVRNLKFLRGIMYSQSESLTGSTNRHLAVYKRIKSFFLIILNFLILFIDNIIKYWKCECFSRNKRYSRENIEQGERECET